MLLYLFLLTIIQQSQNNHLYMWSNDVCSDTMASRVASIPNFMDALTLIFEDFEHVNLNIFDHSMCEPEKAEHCFKRNRATTSLMNEFHTSRNKIFRGVDADILISFMTERCKNYSLTHLNYNDQQGVAPVNMILLSKKSVYHQTLTKANDIKHELNMLLTVEKPLFSFLNTRADSPLVVPMKSRGLIDDGQFFNFNDCIYFYFYSGFTIHKGKIINLLTSMATVDPSSSCTASASNLKLTFSNVAPYSAISVDFSFNIRAKSSWQCKSLVVNFITNTQTETVFFKCPNLSTRLGLSYMCDNLAFNNASNDPQQSTSAGFVYAQVQPFVSKESNNAFSPADSCIYFLTIPISMGIVVGLTFLVGALVGLFALLSIKSITRIENPKDMIDLGQTIK